MIKNFGPIHQACMGTLLTWALTAAGAAVVIFFKGTQQKLLDGSLGFAAGVMLAASYWSLLDPALEMAQESELYGENGEYSFAPVAFGFFVGALFVYGADLIISALGIHSPQLIVALACSNKDKHPEEQRGLLSTKKSDSEGNMDWVYNQNSQGVSLATATGILRSDERGW